MKMNTKKLLVSFVAIVAVLFFVASVSAGEIASDVVVQVNDINVIGPGSSTVGLVAGENVEIEVIFTALVDAQEVRIDVEIDSDEFDVDARSSLFDIENGTRYRKVLTLRIPNDFDDELSDIAKLEVEISDGDDETEVETTLTLQRTSFDADIKSVSAAQSVYVGEQYPVDVTLKNEGYNDLDDVFVTVSIPALGIQRTAYFGDIVALECDENKDSIKNYGIETDRRCNEDDEDTVTGRVYLDIPFGVVEGVYALEVEVTNDDTTSTAVRQILIQNNLPANVIASSTMKTASVGETLEYSILIVNPTNRLIVYRVISESTSGLSSSANEAVIAIPAGSSKTVTVTARADAEGEFNFNVNVFDGNDLVDSVALSARVEGNNARTTATNPVVVMTIILAIIFLVLLVVLIVLISKKPEKAEEFGESYY